MRTGRKLLSLLLAAVLCLSLLPLPILAEDLTIPPADTAETAADGTFGAVFPDAIFRDYVWDTVLSTSQDDKSYDSVITDAQWAAIRSWTGVAVGERDIASLAGIEHFTAMTTLNCSQNSLSTLDLSANTALQELYCDQNQLTELDLSHNVALQKLSCNRNQLTSLTVAPLAKLTLLDCGDNQLTALDVSGSTALVHLYLANNRLTALDVTQNAALKWLVCTGNPISELDLRNNPALLHLNCINCSLTELDLGANTALTTLYCDSNQLTALDISANTALENLSCPSNQIKSLDLSTNTALTLLDCCYNQLVRLDLDANTALTSVSPYDQMPQTDIAITQTGDDYTVSLKDILGADTDLSRVTVQNNGTLDTGTGIVTFPYMTAYVRYTYNTHSPDNTGMRVVLQLNHEHEMHAVNLRDATCTVYGVTQEHWECSLCNGCFPDQEGTTRLVWESVHSCPTGHDLSDWTVITAVTDTAPGRMEQTCSRCKNTYVHLLPPTAATFQDIFPDDAFRAYVRDTVLEDSAVEDTVILTEDQWTRIRNRFDVQVSYQDITSLEGLQYFEGLNFLICDGNQLTELPLLESPDLYYISCGTNQLTSLNVSQLPGLRILYCSGNQLTSLDLSANPILETLGCNYNALAELDVSKNPALSFLDCSRNALTELDISKNLQLTYLGCEDNRLTKLDLSANTVLECIFCGNNLLRSLDVASDSLRSLGCTPQGLIRTDKAPVQQSDGSYTFDLNQVLNGGDPHRVTMLDGGDLDPATGIVTYPEDAFPYQIIYSYSTGEWEAMDVFLLIPHQHALTKIPVYAATCTESGCSTEHWECSLCDQCFLDEAGEQLVHWSDVHAIRMGHDRQSETILIQPTENAAGRAETTCSHCGQVFPRVLPPTNATFAAVFPDDAFRSYVTDSVLILSREGTEDTDVITDAQWETIRRCQFLSVADLGIRSLAGVEYFEDLQWLYCNGNQLTTLDLRDNAVLESVYCYDNQLTELNVTGLSFLRSVSCANNQLSALDFRSNPALQELYCSGNRLMVLDLSSNPKVNYLDCNPQQELETELAPQWDDEMNAYTLNLKALLGENTDFSRITLLDDIELDPDTGIARFIAIPASLTYRYALYPENENLVLEVKILLPHTHSLFQVRERAADCLTGGCLQDHWECSYCGDCFADSQGTERVARETFHVPAAGHAFQVTVKTSATAGSAGLADIVCTACGLSVQRVLPPTNTTFAAAFPDAAFRAYVTAALGIVSGDSSVITQDQWEAIRSIDTVTVTGLGIQDLSGIEYFESMRELSCSRNALTTLDLRYNYSLTELYCERNQLTRLDVSGCPSLTALYCNDNQLTELDLSGRAVLRSLKFSGNPLVTLNASGCRKLLTLECPNRKLKSLILTDCDHLAILNCDGNQLTTLDLSGCSALDTLNCGQNQLRSLDLSSCVKLRSLYCEENQFLTLDLSQNTLLTALVCQPQSVSGQLPLAQGADGSFRYNLKALLGGDTALSRVTMEDGGTLDRTTGIVTYSMVPSIISYVYDTGASTQEAGMSVIISLPHVLRLVTAQSATCTQTGLLAHYYCSDCGKYFWDENAQEETSKENVTLPAKGHRGEWTVTVEPTASTSGSQELTCTVCRTKLTETLPATGLFASVFPDMVFRAYVTGTVLASSTEPKGNSDLITETQWATIRSWQNINLNRVNSSEAKSSSLEGIQYFTGLTVLDCAGNQLSTLDLSTLTKLTQLDCGRNRLTSLDVSQNTQLKILACGENAISSLDLRNNSALESIVCYSNSLGSLLLGEKPTLTSLICYDNRLKALDLSAAPKLEILLCSDNQLTSLDLSTNTALKSGSNDVYYGRQKVFSSQPVQGQEDGSYTFDLGALLGSAAKTANVTMADGGTLDRTTGIVTYSQQPAEICYRCSIPGRDDMDVTVTALVTQAEIRNNAISLTVAEQVPQVYFAAYTENGQIVGIYDAIWAGDRYVIQAPENAASYRWKAFFADGSFVPETWAYEFSFQ